MSRKTTETMDAKDFLQFAQQGSSAPQTGTALDFEAYWNTTNNFFNTVWIASDHPGELYGGVFFRYLGGALSTVDLLQFNSDASQLGRVRINAANDKLELIVGGVAGAAEIGSVNIQLGTNYHLQFRYKVSVGAGVFEAKLDEDLDVLTYNGDTTNGGFTYVNRIEFPVSGSGTLFDSFYVNDTIGIENNGYDGVVHMISAVPPADGFWQDWGLSSGVDGFAMVNQTPHDSDVTIVYSNANGEKVSFTVAPHGLTAPSEIMAVSARWVVRKVSDGRVRPFFRIGGVDYPIVAGSVPIGVGYCCVMDRRTTNPATGLPWALGDTIESVGLESIL